MKEKDFSSIQSRKNTPQQSFKELADYILKYSNHNTLNNKRVHIIVLYPGLEWNAFHEYLATLTWFTGIGWNNSGSRDCNVIFTENLDEALNQANQYNHAMISLTGNYYRSYSTIDKKIIQDYFLDFCHSNYVCKGHLLFHPNKDYGRLHLQCMFMNLDHWRKIGRPMVSGKYTGEVMLPERSKHNVHDDYTPFWISPSKKYGKVKDWPMGEYITKVLEDNKKIINFTGERNTKFFCYPERDNLSDQLLLESNRKNDIVYERNNEKLKKYDQLPSHEYDVIYSPAAGEMSEYLFTKFGGPNTKLVIYDFIESALDWKKKLYENATKIEDVKKISEYIKKKHNCWIDTVDYRTSIVEENTKIFSPEKWMDTLSKIKDVEFIQCNVVEKMLPVDETKNNLIVFSNIFSYIFLLHCMSVPDIHNSLLKYYKLKNTVICGKNVFRDKFINDNISS